MPPQPPSRPLSAPEVVDPRWIIRAGVFTIGFALLCAYVLLCVVFVHTQWQYVLRPSRDVPSSPSSVGLPFSSVRFGPDASGQPQLDGWWLPADVPSDPTVLLLHNANGSMSDALPQARALHDARLNVLLFDYRGFGHSGGQHPTQALMQADAESAFLYLTTIRHVAPGALIAYGSGAGASLAVNLCARHKDIAALILDAPQGDFLPEVQHDARTRIVPVRLLFHEDFPLAAPLQHLSTPKLLISYNTPTAPKALQQAADPKITAELLSPTDSAALHTTLRRFVETYLPQPPPQLSKP